MTDNFLASIKRRMPARAKRAYRRVVPAARAQVQSSPTVLNAVEPDPARIAALEAELARERERARRAELRIDFVREEASRAVSDARAAAEEASRALADARAAAEEASRAVADSPPSSEGASAVSSVVLEPGPDGDFSPSFRYKLGEQRRLSQELTALDSPEPVWTVNPKLDGRAWAEKLGVRVPALLAGPTAIEELDLLALPDHFVIKPISGHSSRGVFLLHRTAPDQFRSLLDKNEVHSRADLISRYAQWAEKGSIPNMVIVEELLFNGRPESPRPPIDFRFFCFYGEVGFVMARDGHGIRAGSRVRFRFFDDRWEDLGVVRLDVRNDARIAVPRQADAMMDAARHLSAAIPRPMVRIDLFDTDDAVYFGEVTPFPGGNFAMASVHDRRFGQQWERAEARLEREAIAAGIRALHE